MIILLLCVVLLCPTVYSSDASVEWCYHEPRCDSTTWSKNVHDYCSGTRQSPINIVTSNIMANSKLTPFNFTGFDDNSTFFSIGNTGDSVVVSLDGDKMTVEGGDLPSKYTSVQFHLHWGNGSSVNGSEHTVDGKRYPMELHIVNVHSKYNGNAKAAIDAKDPNGLAVLGFFVEGSSVTSKSKGWEILTSFLPNITNSSVTTTDIINTTTMNSLLEGVDRTKYYRYQGSLTTPRCNEIVIWTVFKDPIKVNHDLIQLFSTTVQFKGTSTKMANNFRGVQNMNGRIVTSQVASAASSTVIALTFYILAILPFICWL
ncbi:carbonic anhydrase 4-like [Triplophysa dalaica]|uniref:carbonic anhydrase 4-like n=1 Tax=Triplophysa dalaica TaxID=1582913 RepID=UPI0024E01A4E|nr:carbonic anhydrase 4-like [Triplophysa dalaica]